MRRGFYNRKKVYEYAKKWALSSNPKYYNYQFIGGDCTNFVSQCIFAGCNEMNYSRANGWYYINANEKSPSWTGVEFLYDFLVNNQGAGPYGEVREINKLKIGDVIQLSFDGINYTHSLLVIQNGTGTTDTLIATHTQNAFGKKVSEYTYSKYRCIHVDY